jgi:hypothetical protein
MPDDAIPCGVPSVGAHPIKVAARITATATWVRLIIADKCPKADLFSGVVRSLLPSGDNPPRCLFLAQCCRVRYETAPTP